MRGRGRSDGAVAQGRVQSGHRDMPPGLHTVCTQYREWFVIPREMVFYAKRDGTLCPERWYFMPREMVFYTQNDGVLCPE